MHNVTIDNDAARELWGASEYYEDQEPGRGIRFLNEVQAKLKEINSDPLLFRVAARGLRRAYLNSFPFGLLYRVKNDKTEILAVMHCSRDPGTWLPRIKIVAP